MKSDCTTILRFELFCELGIGPSLTSCFCTLPDVSSGGVNVWHEPTELSVCDFVFR